MRRFRKVTRSVFFCERITKIDFSLSFRLHEEIEDFYKFIIPTPLELEAREQIVMKIQSLIKQHYPRANVEVFGSTRTGLYLPTGDIDLVR